jgi:cytochrome c biogenesis protein CcmG/thiol:disulfide interchange protein DsbE
MAKGGTSRKPPPAPAPAPRSTRVIWLATAGVGAAVALAVAVLVLTRSNGPKPPPAASVSASDRNVPESLGKAAEDSGFHPTTEPGIGEIEDKPASAANPPFSKTLLAPGTTAPGFTLKTPQGQTYSLAQFRGKPVLLELFATWCPHCNAEAPHLARLAKTLAGKAQFLSVNADGEDAGSVFAYHRYYAFPFPALLDPSDKPGSFGDPGSPGPVSKAYKVSSFPTFYVIGPRGRVSWASDGEQPDAKLRQELLRAGRA